MIKVLIADDEKLECQALEKMLHKLFPAVTVLESAADGAQLIRSVREQQPDISIVDINMPGLNGLDALEILRNENCKMEIIIHTAYSEFDYIHQAMKLGASDYLVKPVFEEDFEKAFSRVLEITCRRKQTLHPEGVSGSDVHEMAEHNILMSLMLGEPDRSSWKVLADRSGCRDCAGRIAVFRMDTACTDNTDEAEKFLRSCLQYRCRTLLLRNGVDIVALLLAAPGGDSGKGADLVPADQNATAVWLRECINSFEVNMGMELRAGVSSYTDALEHMSGAFQEAMTALKNQADQKVHSEPEGGSSCRTIHLSGERVSLPGQLKRFPQGKKCCLMNRRMQFAGSFSIR